MKNIVLLISILFSLNVLVGQSACCKNKAKGVSCARSVEAVVDSENNPAEIVKSSCCKNKSNQGVSCSKNKENSINTTCSTKKWWQIWKKGCSKPCCGVS